MPAPSTEELASLLEHVRFGRMRPEFVETHVEGAHLLANVPCMRVLSQAFREAAFSADTPRTRARTGFGPSTLHVMGGCSVGEAGGATLGSAEVLDGIQQSWQALPSLPAPVEAAAAAALRGELALLGGCSAAGDSLAAVHVFAPSSGQWRSGPPMRIARDALAATTCEGAIYVTGGLDATKTPVADVERWAPHGGVEEGHDEGAATASWCACHAAARRVLLGETSIVRIAACRGLRPLSHLKQHRVSAASQGDGGGWGAGGGE